MLTLPPDTKIFLATSRIDGRKGIDGLAAIVRGQFLLEPLEGGLFVFFSRRADRVRVLFFDRDGYVLITKRLEKGRFHTPWSDVQGSHRPIEAGELLLILEGIDLRDARRRPRWSPRTRAA